MFMIHTWFLPSDSATNAILDPSGETSYSQAPGGNSLNAVPSPVVTSTRYSRGSPSESIAVRSRLASGTLPVAKTIATAVATIAVTAPEIVRVARRRARTIVRWSAGANAGTSQAASKIPLDVGSEGSHGPCHE